MAGMGGVMVGKWDKTGIKILLRGAGKIILLGEETSRWYAGSDKQGFLENIRLYGCVPKTILFMNNKKLKITTK